MIRHNHWMTYSYNNIINGRKSTPSCDFSLHYNAAKITAQSFHQALYHNAIILEQEISPPYDVLLSGGIDSEVVVRVNHDLGISQNVYTFRYEDNLNIRDLESAKNLCDELNIKLNIIDFNVKRFIERDAYDLYHQTYFPKIDYLTKIKWLEYLDHTPIFGNGEPYWRKINPSSSNSEWMLDLIEHEFSMGLWHQYSGRTIIGEWYLYTPDIMMTYHGESTIKKLINNEIVGKTSSWSSRYGIYRNIWPTVRNNIKLVGFEGEMGSAGSCPPYIQEFKDTVLKNTANKNFLYSVRDLENNISG